MRTRSVIAGTILAVVLAGIGWSLAREGSELDRLKNKDAPVSMDFKDTNVSQILKVASMAGSFKLTLGESFHEVKVTLPQEKTTLKGLLVRAAEAAGLIYTVPNPDELVVEMTPE